MHFITKMQIVFSRDNVYCVNIYVYYVCHVVEIKYVKTLFPLLLSNLLFSGIKSWQFSHLIVYLSVHIVVKIKTNTI